MLRLAPRRYITIVASAGWPSTFFRAVSCKDVDGGAKPRHDEYTQTIPRPDSLISKQVLSLTLAILEKRSSGQLNTTSSKTPVSSAAR